MGFRSFCQYKVYYQGLKRGARWRLSQYVVMGYIVLLLASGAGAEPLLDAAANGDVSEVKRYLAQGADINVMDADGFRPLHWAVFGGYKEMVKLLVNNGAALDVQNDDGLTPLHSAVLAGRPKVVKQLITLGADTTTTTHDGNTARNMAIIRGQVAIVDMLNEQPALAHYQTKASRANAGKVANVTQMDKTKPIPALKAVLTPPDRFLIQLASVKSESVAERIWAQYQKSFPDLLGTNQLLIERVDLARKGVFYRVRTGPFTDKQQAQALCNHIKAHNKACLIIHN